MPDEPEPPEKLPPEKLGLPLTLPLSLSLSDLESLQKTWDAFSVMSSPTSPPITIKPLPPAVGSGFASGRFGYLLSSWGAWGWQTPESKTVSCRCVDGPLAGEELEEPPPAKSKDYFFVVYQNTEPKYFVGAWSLGTAPLYAPKFQAQRGRYQLEKDIKGFFVWKWEGWREMGWWPKLDEIFGQERIADSADYPWVFQKTQE